MVKELSKHFAFKELMMSDARKKTFVLMIQALFVCLIVCAGCEKKEQFHMPPRPVRVSPVVKKDAPVFMDSFGTLRSSHVVDVKPQVAGEIKDVLFREGEHLSEGALLVLIDPRQYQVEVDKASAALKQNEVLFKIKSEMLERNKTLVDQQLISSQEFDQLASDAAAADAAVSVSKAALEAAGLNLAYCSIKSPIEGVAGRRLVDPGNVVANTGAVLVNIRKMNPLYVDFTVSERELVRIREAMKKNETDVRVTLPGSTGDAFAGSLDFLENTVDEQTGTVLLRAIIPNDEKKLWPGQFVEVRLTLEIQKNALVVPASAVRLGKNGNYVFVISADNSADLRHVTISGRVDDYVMIQDGVKEGESVVVAGQMGLAPGAKARVLDEHQ